MADERHKQHPNLNDVLLEYDADLRELAERNAKYWAEQLRGVVDLLPGDQTPPQD